LGIGQQHPNNVCRASLGIVPNFRDQVIVNSLGLALVPRLRTFVCGRLLDLNKAIQAEVVEKHRQPSGSFLYRSDQGVIPMVNPEPFPAKASP
jgi:hypothetical protein